MEQKTAEAIMQFMQRVQLTGQEVPVFNHCMAELIQIARPSELREVPKDEPEAEVL